MKLLALIGLTAGLLFSSVAAQADARLDHDAAVLTAAVVHHEARYYTQVAIVRKVIVLHNAAWVSWDAGLDGGEAYFRKHGASWKLVISGSRVPITAAFMQRSGLRKMDAFAIVDQQRTACLGNTSVLYTSGLGVVCEHYRD